MEFKDLSTGNLRLLVLSTGGKFASEALRVLLKRPEISLVEIQRMAGCSCRDDKIKMEIQMAIIGHSQVGMDDVEGIMQWHGTSEEVRAKCREALQSPESLFVLGLLGK